MGAGLDPKTAATHGARLVINWLRGEKKRAQEAIEADLDYEAPNEGQQIDMEVRWANRLCV